MLVMEGIYRKRRERMEHLQEIRNEGARLTMLTDVKRQMMQSDLHTREEHSGQVQIIIKKISWISLTANAMKTF